MNVNLTPELEAFVQRKVESGLYNNQSEVVREALRLLVEQDRLREAQLGKLRSALSTKGLRRQCGANSWMVPEIVAELRESLRRRNKCDEKGG